MSKTRLFAVLMVIFCTLLTATAQIMFKLGTNSMTSFKTAIINYFIWTGLILYGLGFLIFIVALKYGELSTLYPFFSLSFIWVTFLSMIIFAEIVTAINWLGVISVVVGVSLIGRGASHG